MKSHFVFSKSERNGIFLLVTIILVLQLAYWLIPFPKYIAPKDTPELVRFQQKVDSLKQLKIKENKLVDTNSQKGYGLKKLKVNNNKIKRVLKWYPNTNLKDIIADILLNKFNYKYLEI